MYAASHTVYSWFTLLNSIHFSIERQRTMQNDMMMKEKKDCVSRRIRNEEALKICSNNRSHKRRSILCLSEFLLNREKKREEKNFLKHFHNRLFIPFWEEEKTHGGMITNNCTITPLKSKDEEKTKIKK